MLPQMNSLRNSLVSSFEEKSDISAKDPCVVIQAERLSDQAREVMDYLEQFSVVNQVVIPIKTDDHWLW